MICEHVQTPTRFLAGGGMRIHVCKSTIAPRMIPSGLSGTSAGICKVGSFGELDIMLKWGVEATPAKSRWLLRASVEVPEIHRGLEARQGHARFLYSTRMNAYSVTCAWCYQGLSSARQIPA